MERVTESNCMPVQPDPSEVTLFLRRWRDGDENALGELLPRVYNQLRDIARARLRAERVDHTLDTTALVHETYLRLTGGTTVDWQDRAHFFAVASTAMRRVLIDHAKQRHAQKRGGAIVQVDLDFTTIADAATTADTEPEAILALDEALQKLEKLHPRQAKAVELRYFAGLTLDEASEVLSTSAPTVLRDLRFAQAWLARELG